jgi:septum site-determining protein MinD
MLAVAGGKGGVGTTTAALGLGYALARSGRDPVVLDADVDMPDLHVAADVDREPTADRLAAGASVGRIVQQSTALPGVGVVPAGSPGSLPAALRRADRWHGPVIVDCPAGAGRDVARPFRESDRCLLVSTDTPQAVEDTAKTAAAARSLSAAPVGALVRSTGDDADAPFRCPVVGLPAVDSRPVAATPRFQAACQRVVGLLRMTADGRVGPR